MKNNYYFLKNMPHDIVGISLVKGNIPYDNISAHEKFYKAGWDTLLIKELPDGKRIRSLDLHHTCYYDKNGNCILSVQSYWDGVQCTFFPFEPALGKRIAYRTWLWRSETHKLYWGGTEEIQAIDIYKCDEYGDRVFFQNGKPTYYSSFSSNSDGPITISPLPALYNTLHSNKKDSDLYMPAHLTSFEEKKDTYIHSTQNDIFSYDKWKAQGTHYFCNDRGDVFLGIDINGVGIPSISFYCGFEYDERGKLYRARSCWDSNFFEILEEKIDTMGGYTKIVITNTANYKIEESLEIRRNGEGIVTQMTEVIDGHCKSYKLSYGEDQRVVDDGDPFCILQFVGYTQVPNIAGWIPNY